MKKYLFTIIFTVIFFGFFLRDASAQMMGALNSSIDQQAIQQQQAEEQDGKKLLDQLKNKITTCQKLTDDNFEKIGEYFMGQAIGEISRHIAMNNMMKSMMGKNGEEQMHISWGKRGSDCENISVNSNQGGVNSVMGYGMNWMMGGAYGFSILSSISSLLVIIVLALLAIFLWKQIQKK